MRECGQKKTQQEQGNLQERTFKKIPEKVLKCSKENISISVETEFTIPQINPHPHPKATETKRILHKIPTSQIETDRKKQTVFKCGGMELRSHAVSESK